MSQIADIQRVADTYNTKILVVSKNRTNEAIMKLYNMGFRAMGENRVQSLLDKRDDLPQDIEWHIIGTLQRNKVKYIADFVTLIHSVDSLKLAKEINKEAEKAGRIIPILLQFKVAKEEDKHGLSPNNYQQFMEDFLKTELPFIEVHGIMGMGTFTDDKDLTRKEFRALKSVFDILKKTYYADDSKFKELSMGMSGDYEIALEEGSTILRLGSILFQ